METNDEIAQLKKEVAELRRQMVELHQFINVEERDELPGKPKIMLMRCATIILSNPEKPNQTQGMLAGGNEGPFLALWGDDDRARILLQVDKEGGSCEFYGKDLKKAVQITANDESGRGQVGVFEQDKPRALIKASQTGGAVSVLHDDNHPRLLMHANEDSGELIAVNQDMKTTVKITSDGLHGGMLTVHGSHGRPLVALCGSQPCGLVMVKDDKANVIASLPALPEQEGEEE